MRLTISPTRQIVEVNGVPARIWEGVSDQGVPVTLFVTRLAVDEKDDHGAFMRELEACPVPTVAWPTRLVL